MRTISSRTITHLGVAFAAAVLIAACSSADDDATDQWGTSDTSEQQADDDVVETIAEKPDRSDGDSEGTSDDSEGATPEDAVRAALTDFVALMDDFDHGDATVDEVTVRLSDGAAAEVAAGELSWVAWDGTPEGRRTVHDMSVTMHDDDAGSFTLCMEDVRETRETAPNGVYYLNAGRLVSDGDDGWLVDVFFDPVKDDQFARPVCVPEDVEEELRQVMRDLNDAWWQFTAQDTYPWTEDLFQDDYLAAAYYEFVDQSMLDYLRDVGQFRTGEAVQQFVIDPDRWTVVPGIVPVLRCGAPTRMWANDLETGEVVREVDLSEGVLAGTWRVGVWVFEEEGEFAGKWLEKDVADYGDGMDICGPLDQFEQTTF